MWDVELRSFRCAGDALYYPLLELVSDDLVVTLNQALFLELAHKTV